MELHDWRQFSQVTLDFHPRATVLTGANASGKTTILALLARHFGWPSTFFGLTYRTPDGKFAFFLSHGEREQWRDIGSVTYDDGNQASLRVPTAAPDGAAAAYDVALQGQQTFPGLYLTSHRSVSNYTKIDAIPASFGDPTRLYDTLRNELVNRHRGQRSTKSPFQLLKESLIAAAVFGEGSRSVEQDPIAAQVWARFQDILQIVLPESLGFRRLRVRAPEVIVETASGPFPIDEASGGLSAIVELSWQVLLRSFSEDKFVVLFDEPENHLHPELQREIVPSLLQAFPEIQFVIATHSPSVVTSVPDSAVYVLDYNSDRLVQSRYLERVNRAASADETLQRVLGLSSTLPSWAEVALERTLDRYLQQPMDAEAFLRLRVDLEELGLEGVFPTAAAQVARDQTARGEE